MGVNSWVAHANRSIYGQDADSFRPERWLEDEPTVNRMEQYFFAVSVLRFRLYKQGEHGVRGLIDSLTLVFHAYSSAAGLAHV